MEQNNQYIRLAMDAEASVATHEQIKTYLDQSDIYAACDCECRHSACLAGESCSLLTGTKVDSMGGRVLKAAEVTYQTEEAWTMWMNGFGR